MNIVFRPTSNAYVNIWDMKTNKFIDEFEDLFPW